MMSTLKLKVPVNVSEAIRRGHGGGHRATLEIDPQTLSPERREQLAVWIDQDGEWRRCIHGLNAPTEAALWEELDRQDAADAERERQRAAREAEAREEFRQILAARRTETTREIEYVGDGRGQWERVGPARPFRGYRNLITTSPEAEAWLAELEALNERARADARSRAEAEAARLKAERAEQIRLLREWAEAHGSDLLRARIEEECEWVSLAEQEWADAAASSAGEPICLEGYDLTDRERPGLGDIQALRRVREAIEGRHGEPCCKIVWASREAEYDYELDEDIEADSTAAIQVTVTTPTGRKVDRYFQV